MASRMRTETRLREVTMASRRRIGPEKVLLSLDGRHDVPVEREIRLTAVSGAATGKGNYRHFMEKELHEHPGVIAESLQRLLDGSRVALPSVATCST